MSETHIITGAQLRAAYGALGLDPALLDDTTEIILTPHAASIRRFKRNEDGRYHDERGSIAMTTTVLEVRTWE